jgi:hypothetical protein
MAGGMTTLVKDHTGEPLLLHGWYSRSWDTNPNTHSRYRIAVDYARWKQGLPRRPWGTFPNVPREQTARLETCPTTSAADHSPLTTHHSPMGNWAALFASNRDAFPFGDTLTYEKAAAFLGGLESVEDWGCGQSWFRRYLNPAVRYKGIDGSQASGLDELADLTTYTSRTEGILLRHVLEHNSGWEAILKNALQSFTKRLVIVLFTPFAETTRQLAFNPTIQVPDIAFAREDLVRHFDGLKWSAEENLGTKTQYGVEHVFYLEKNGSRRGTEKAESAKRRKKKSTAC